MVFSRALVCSALFAFAAATAVQQCPGESIENLSDNVQLSCKSVPCKLKQGKDQHIQITFTPTTDVPDVRNHVQAEVFSVPLPFIGVDGLSVCDKIKTEDGQKASCPLKAGTKYIYTDSFPVLSVYPRISLKVHWSLQNGSKDIICFEVPAKITM